MEGVFRFIFPNLDMVFDLEQEKIILKEGGETREFFLPMNAHNFYVVGGSVLFGKPVPGKAKFKAGRPGESQVIEIRAFSPKDKKQSKPSGESGEGKEEEENTASATANGDAKKADKAIMVFIDEKGSYKRSVLLNKANLYALLEVFRQQDKVVPLDGGEVVFEKRDGQTMIQGNLVPFQKAKALYYLLDNYLRTGKLPPVHQEWDGLKIVIVPSKKRKRIEVFKKRGDNFIPAGTTRINPENALRIMSAL